MGIQGLGGYLDNNDLTVYYNKERDGKKNFKFLYLDFQSIIYTVFNYQENIINMMLSNIHSFDITHTNLDNNTIILSVLNKIRLVIKDSEFGKKLLTFNKKKITMKGNIDVPINLIDKEFEYNIENDWKKHLTEELIEDIKFGIENYISNKMNYVSDCIIELIHNLITKFDNLEECHIIFDGKPFVAKMIEQIKRRTPDSIVTDMISDIEKSLTKNGIIDLPKNIFFDRSLISRDSDFVHNLIKKFKALNLKVKDKPAQEFKIEVISTEDGEGEHIINKKILEKAIAIEDGNFLYYSPDGDVVFLIMILNIILRMNGKKSFVHLIKFELIDYTYYKFETKQIETSRGKVDLNYVYFNGDFPLNFKIDLINKILEQTKIELQYNDINNFENMLLSNITTMFGEISNKSKNIMLIQYIILFSIFGNDFIPKLLSVTIGQIDSIVKIYNKYLNKKATLELKDIKNFLKRDIGDFTSFKFLANFDGNNIVINQTVLLDFFKELCNFDSEDCNKNEQENINKKLRNESRKKDIKEIIDSFETKIILLNYTNKNVSFEFLKHLLYNNYYISLKDLNIPHGKEAEFKKINSDLVKITRLLKSPVITEEINKEIKEFEDKYYSEILNENAYQYLYGANPIKSNFSQIINYDKSMKAEDPKAIKQYIQGFQYIADLYFTCDVKNKCWYYQYENPPRITEIIKYMTDNAGIDLLDYSGFYGEMQETLYDSISHKLTRKINTQYIKGITSAKYYLIPQIFDCYNIRYLNKCQLHGDTNIIFLNEEGQIINIMDESFEQTKPKPQKILKLAQEALVHGGMNNYYKKYLKYKMKYIMLKKIL